LLICRTASRKSCIIATLHRTASVYPSLQPDLGTARNPARHKSLR
jgi:hypothetical protein